MKNHRDRNHVQFRSQISMVAFAMAFLSILLAFIGPFLSPYDPRIVLGLPLQSPTYQHLLGLDYLGRDVLSRVLHGGWRSICTTVLGFVSGLTVGALLGMFSAYRRGIIAFIFLFYTEIFIGFPSLILLLLLVSVLNPSPGTIIFALFLNNVPRIGRLVYAASLPVISASYLQVADGRGESQLYLVLSELLPNIKHVVATDAAMRLPASLLLVAGLNFLGLGFAPPTPDWGAMITENRMALFQQPFAILAPLLFLLLLTIGINLFFDESIYASSKSARTRNSIKAKGDNAICDNINELRIEDLAALAIKQNRIVVRDIAFNVSRSQSFGIVGESGSGKTTLAKSIMGYLPYGMCITAGRVLFDNTDFLQLSMARKRAYWGKRIAYVGQDSLSALTPTMKIRDAMNELLWIHARDLPDSIVWRDSILSGLQLSKAHILDRYPYQLSGGERQRVAIALALLGRPDVVIFDEPTAALDAITERYIINYLQTYFREHASIIIYISHNLDVVSALCDSIAVMYKGYIIEQGEKQLISHTAWHPYTQQLFNLSSMGHNTNSSENSKVTYINRSITGCPFVNHCTMQTEDCSVAMPPIEVVVKNHYVRCWNWQSVKKDPKIDSNDDQYSTEAAELNPKLVSSSTAKIQMSVKELSLKYRKTERVRKLSRSKALDEVSLTLYENTSIALVGKSGAGKSTLLRAIAGLESSYKGTIELRGELLAKQSRKRRFEQRRLIQLIPQDPNDSLNPSHKVGEIVGRPLEFFFGISGVALKDRVTRLLGTVQLGPEFLSSYPYELSGGEKQRVAIARSLAAEPSLILCDEITSALDVVTKSDILKLLTRLKSELNLTLLVSTHDLWFAKNMSSIVMLIDSGKIMEISSTKDFFSNPKTQLAGQLVSSSFRSDLLDTYL